MKFVADLHTHSRFAMATSKYTDLEHLAEGAKAKGISLLGTGDFTHPKWFAELKTKLDPLSGAGLYSYLGVTWMLSGEVSTVYQQEGRTRKVHHLIYAPDFEVVAQINKVLAKHGSLGSDGRPVLTGIDSAELLESVTSISTQAFLVPAHAWTPWFGVLGSKSGFDSLRECYQDQTGKVFAIETGLSCYDEETEVLTEAGWRRFPELTADDRICTLDPASEEIEYQQPTRLTMSRYRGKMYKLMLKRVNLLVTPNHKLFVTQFAARGPKPYNLREAAEAFGKSKTFRKDGRWSGERPEFFDLPKVKVKHGSRYYSGWRAIPSMKLPIRLWLEFFGLWLAEGHTNKGSQGDYNVILSNTDKRIISRMLWLFRELGFSPLLLEPQPGAYQVRVRSILLYTYLERFGQSHQKFIPVDVKRLAPDLLRVLLAAYLKGDGHVYGRTRKGLSAATTSVCLRDDLQEIALKAGMSAYFKLGARKGTPIRSLHGGKYKSAHDAWVVYFIRHNRPVAVPSVMKRRGNLERWVEFDGPVYCVTVPNHVIYVRRNGIPVWCGNSDPPMNWRLSALDGVGLISNSDAHSPNPWRLGREANAFDLPGLTYRGVFDAIRAKDRSKFLFTIEVDPSYGKYHFTGHKKCGVSLPPAEASRLGNRCPKCGKKLTVGVLQRVEALADRPAGYVPEGAVPFKRLLPLYEVISVATGVNRLYARKVIELQDALIAAFGSELAVLLDADEEGLTKHSPARVAAAIVALREGRVKVTPGYDGVYGVPDFG